MASRVICGSAGHLSGFLSELPKFLLHPGVLISGRRNILHSRQRAGVTYHKMHYLSGLSYGKFLYEGRFPTSYELHQLGERIP